MVINIMFLGFGLNYGVTKIAEAVVESANEDVKQEFKSIGSNITISVPLKEKKGIIFKNIMICKPADSDNFFNPVQADGLGSDSSCHNGNCKVTIELKDGQSAPNIVSIYVKSPSGVCKKTEFSAGGTPEIIGYSAKIEFTDKLLQALNINGNNYQIGSTNSQGMHSWQVMGTKKVVFSYSTKPYFDGLKIDGSIKAKIKLY